MVSEVEGSGPIDPMPSRVEHCIFKVSLNAISDTMLSTFDVSYD